MDQKIGPNRKIDNAHINVLTVLQVCANNNGLTRQFDAITP